MDEVSFALEESKRILPILYRPCRVPMRLRRLQRIDFTGEHALAVRALIDALG